MYEMWTTEASLPGLPFLIIDPNWDWSIFVILVVEDNVSVTEANVFLVIF
jgi:hypothetical protein